MKYNTDGTAPLHLRKLSWPAKKRDPYELGRDDDKSEYLMQDTENVAKNNKETLDKLVQNSSPEELEAMRNWAIQQAKLVNESLYKNEIYERTPCAPLIALTQAEKLASFTPQEATLGWKAKYVMRMAKSVTDKNPSGHDVGDGFNRAFVFPAIVVAIHNRATQELDEKRLLDERGVLKSKKNAEITR